MNNKREEEINDFLSEIKKCILFPKNDLPHIVDAIFDVQFNDYESILQALLLGLKKEELVIAEEHNRSYVTDNYENGLRWFTNRLCVVLAKEYDRLKDCNGLEALLNQRHIAYSCYHDCYYKEMEKPRGFKLIHEKAAYLGLMEFYSKFYGRFSDNEEAIVLLCINYPSGMLSEEEEDKLVESLASHIYNAGTINDIGYAYHGIEKIEEHIKMLPDRVVEKIIGQYELFKVLNDKVSRRQLYSLIDASVLQEKHKLKFWCIDSLYIANYINFCLADILKGQNKDITFYHSPFDIMVKDEQIPVFSSPKADWKCVRKEERRFVIENGSPISVCLQGDKIIIQSEMNRKETLELTYQYDDWQMEKKYRSEIKEWIYAVYSSNQEPEKKNLQMTFSLIYLENYRGIAKQTFDFDHQTMYEADTRKLSIRKEKVNKIAHYYGKNVYSLSCIAGRNGTGKSSVIDFLRETFFGFLMIVIENPRACENGYMSEEAYKKSKIFDEGAKFLVACRFGGDMFYLTNIKEVKSTDIEPLTSECLPRDTDMFSKVVYFSNMLKVNQRELFTEGEVEKDSTRPDTIRLLTKNFKQVDFSETQSFVKKQRALNEIKKYEEGSLSKNKEQNEKNHYNKELCYQILMMNQLGKDEIKRYMDFCGSKKFIIRSKYMGTEECFTPEEKRTGMVKISFEEIRRNSQTVQDVIVKFKNCPDAQFDFFSSGEYMKFSFIAKLNWLLNGIQYKQNLFDGVLQKYDFDMEECLQEGDMALIFIDEGELYYHPEWQRQYLSTLLEIINKAENVKVQIILTTNSPFIVSDVLGEDVLYLMKEGETTPPEPKLGQNIHQLLTENFFMDCVIGEYVKQFIQDIKKLIIGGSETTEISKKYFGREKCTYEDIRRAIDLLGETVYRFGLEKMLSDSLSKEQTIYELEQKKQLIEKEITRLRGARNDKA